MDEDILRATLEALLFVANEPLKVEDLQSLLACDAEKISQALQALKEVYAGPHKGIWLQEAGGGWRMVTNPYVGEVVEAYEKKVSRERLSPQAIEVLAIVAYKQPITLPEINAIRGVQSHQALQTLLDKGLISPKGRKKVLGRPILYGTSKKFLLHFGLNSLEDLPSLETFMEHAAE